jgi:hypothetical protein
MGSPERDQISDWEGELLRIRQESEWLAEQFTEEQFNWRPGPARWSVGECFDHLAIATGLMLEKVKPEVERGRREGVTGTPPFRYKLAGGWFVAMMEKPPGKRGMPAPGNFVPPSGTPRAEVLRKYFAVLDDFAKALHESHGLALDRLRAASAAKGGSWLRLNLAAWFAATLAHLRRHLAQAKRVTKTDGFPAR